MGRRRARVSIPDDDQFSNNNFVKMNEITIWDAALYAGCVETFNDRRFHFLRVDVF